MSVSSPGRLTHLTAELRARGTKPLVPFLTAGYPDEQTFNGVLAAAAQAGCPLVEIGIPFSDPVADGPVIQASSQRVLAQGMTLARTLELAADAEREHGLAVVLMGYLNPILKLGPEVFAEACRTARIAGVIIPDLPPEEAGGLRGLLAQGGTDLVDLVAPTTDPERLARNTAQATGFLYLVSTTGVTGTGSTPAAQLPDYVRRVRAITDLPLYVGFGIATPEQAARVAQVADGAIVGSALIRIINEAGDDGVAAAATFLDTMVRAMQLEKGSPS
jgi:tryptophan synthase alpha chain